MKLKTSALIVILLIGLGTAVIGQDKPDDSNKELPVLDRKVNGLLELDFAKPVKLAFVLSDLYSEANLRGGIIYPWNEDFLAESQFPAPRRNTVRDFLDNFAESTDYRWSESRGIVNVYPESSYSIFETKIAKFRVENASPRELLTALIFSKEFQAYMKKRKLFLRVPLGDYTVRVEEPVKQEDRVSINGENLTVREILDIAVRKRASATYWTYREYQLRYKGNVYNILRFGGFADAFDITRFL